MLKSLYSLFKDYWGICILRVPPQDLPYSSFYLQLTLILYTITSAIFASHSLPGEVAVLASVLNTVLLMLLTFIFLFAFRLNERLIKTITALAGAGTILNLLGVPVMAWMQSVELANDDLSIPEMLRFLIVFWDVIIMGYILHHALEVRYTLGLIAALVYLWLLPSTLRILLWTVFAL